MLNSVVLGVIIVALIVIIVLLATISAILIRRDKNREDLVAHVVASSVDSAFREENRKSAKKYRSYKRLIRWIEDLNKRGELDPSKLAIESEKRACALAIMKAEEAVNLSVAKAEKVSHEIAETQKMLLIHTQNPGILEQHKEKLIILREQEILAEERVNINLERLAQLTSTLASPPHVSALSCGSPQS